MGRLDRLFKDKFDSAFMEEPSTFGDRVTGYQHLTTNYGVIQECHSDKADKAPAVLSQDKTNLNIYVKALDRILGWPRDRIAKV